MLSQKDRDELDRLKETVQELRACQRDQEACQREQERWLFSLVLLLVAQRAAVQDNGTAGHEKRVQRVEDLVVRLLLGLLAAAAAVIATLLAIVLT